MSGSIWRRARRFLSGAAQDNHSAIFRDHTRAFLRVQPLIRAFYAVVFFWALLLMPEWSNYLGRADVVPLWPISWLHHVSLPSGILTILLLYLLGSGAAALLPQFRLTRAVAFIGVFQFWAFNNSFGKVGHSLHWLVLVSFVLIFLPGGWQCANGTSRLLRQKTLLIFWMAQAAMAMTYTMAGLIKISCGIYQWIRREPSLFGWEALARHVADRLLQTNSTSFLGSLLIDHLWFSTALMWSVVYLESFFLLTLFRPRLQWLFAAGLIGFHVGSFFTMTITFPQNCLLLVLFFCGMPLRHGAWNWTKFFEDWPVFGDLWRLWKSRRSAPCAS